jgi:K+-sensing histidine kinase KdpD
LPRYSWYIDPVVRRDEAKNSRTVTDKTLGLERNRADDEVLERSTALGETAEDVIRRARDRAQRVLELARRREDHALRDANMANEAREQVVNERAAADDVLATEYADADAEILDELSRRRQAVIQLLALERDDTDRMLESERRDADRLVANRDDLLGSVSHDLRNHLSGLLVRTSFIITTHDDDAPLVSELRAMQTSIAQLD